ncbi:hypothetical protein JL721_11285 [Aureococcus anophagefferens]|nr:hypothetical protein JL721_11285 [Aureococcus anophagefferens]
MDDVALLAPSYEELQALAAELWAWCWRFRWVPYPGEPKTFVFVLGPGAAGEVRDYGGRFSFVHSPAREEFRLTGRVSAAPPDLTVIIPIGTEGRYLGVVRARRLVVQARPGGRHGDAAPGRVGDGRARDGRLDEARAPAHRSSAARAMTAAVARGRRAARECAERQAAGVSDLALFRAVRPSREWRRTWILEQRAAGDRRESALVAILGGTCRLAPQTRLVRVEDAYGRQGREAAARWWRGARAPALSSCSDVGFAAFLAASGAPPLPRGGLAELRDDLARAFASTFGEFFVAHASEITALPPRRST